MSCLSEDELIELEKLSKAATPGPWSTFPEPRLQGGVMTADNHQVATAIGQAAMYDADRGLDTSEVLKANAAFIAASRTAVPQLVEEVWRLRRALAATEGALEASRVAEGEAMLVVHAQDRRIDELRAERDATEGELAALRAVDFEGKQVDLTDPNAGQNPASVLFWKREAEAARAEAEKLREAATKASAELRHLIRFGKIGHDFGLVSRAIELLEKAVTPRKDKP
jgi:hypothetical protein